MKWQLINIVVKLGKNLWTEQELKNAFQNSMRGKNNPLTLKEKIAFTGFNFAKKIKITDDIYNKYISLAPVANTTGLTKYDHHLLHLMLNRVYDMPEVEVNDQRPKTINLLIPAFDFKSMSAGFFGVFQVGKFFKRSGYHVRAVMFDNFYYNEAEFRKKLKEYPGMEDFFDVIEVEYIGERKKPLQISKHDTCIATVWYSAFFAKKIMSYTENKNFIYLIQDYETNFYPGSSSWALADNTYKMDYIALFSTESLQNYFLNNDIGDIKTREIKYTYFNNACSCFLPKKQDFLKLHKNKVKRKLVFYSRPVVSRNMFELTALALIEVSRRGILNPREWECYGMGLGEAEIELLPEVFARQMKRMTLKDYSESLSQFDVCLTLMASPHPSLLPMDLSGSGAIVVTNTCYTKTPEFLESISKNIIAVEPDLNAIVDGIKQAVQRCKDLEARYSAASSMNYPTQWEVSLNNTHATFFKKVLN